MSVTKPPTPEHTGTRSTSGGTNMSPPKPHTTTSPRSSSGGKDMSPPKAVGSARTTPGGTGMAPPAPDGTTAQFVDPIPTRPTPAFTPRSAK